MHTHTWVQMSAECLPVLAGRYCIEQGQAMITRKQSITRAAGWTRGVGHDRTSLGEGSEKRGGGATMSSASCYVTNLSCSCYQCADSLLRKYVISTDYRCTCNPVVANWLVYFSVHVQPLSGCERLRHADDD